MANAKSDAPETAIFTVAKGRTVTNDDGSFGPGEEVILTLAEGARLRTAGFLLLENGKAKINVDGPKVIAGEDIEEKA